MSRNVSFTTHALIHWIMPRLLKYCVVDEGFKSHLFLSVIFVFVFFRFGENLMTNDDNYKSFSRSK